MRKSTPPRLVAPFLQREDLIFDGPLGSDDAERSVEEADLLRHREVAQLVADLVTLSPGRTNVAVHGAWGSGKTSLFWLIRRSLLAATPKTAVVTFDAWKNAGEQFQTNFLSEVALQLGLSQEDTSDQLFRTSRSVRLIKFRHSWVRWLVFCVSLGLIAAIGLLVPAIVAERLPATVPPTPWLVSFLAQIAVWGPIALGALISVVTVTGLLELGRTSIEESTPSRVSEFKRIFDAMIGKAKHRVVILVDELDRCSPEDIAATLIGLRTFLGNDRCTFVVAFDREAVAHNLKGALKFNAPGRSDAPYYATPGEFLDKVFQHQLNLPPKQPGSLRGFATKLVDKKSGLWSELKSAEDGEYRDRVIRILTPYHLVSPRRTKVLLNSFATRWRLAESLGFASLARAQEIAIVSVLETEFPDFYDDLVREPLLVQALLGLEGPVRADLRRLALHYTDSTAEIRGFGIVPDLDSIPGEIKQLGDDPTTEIELQQRRDLLGYLRLLQEIGAPLPASDLILMSYRDEITKYQDPAAQNAVREAPDQEPAFTVARLQGASPRDARRAIEDLLARAEGSSPEFASPLVQVVGELLTGVSSDEFAMYSKQLVTAWLRAGNGSPTRSAAVSRSWSTGMTGVVRAIHRHASVADAEAMYFELRSARAQSIDHALNGSAMAIRELEGEFRFAVQLSGLLAFNYPGTRFRLREMIRLAAPSVRLILESSDVVSSIADYYVAVFPEIVDSEDLSGPGLVEAEAANDAARRAYVVAQEEKDEELLGLVVESLESPVERAWATFLREMISSVVDQHPKSIVAMTALLGRLDAHLWDDGDVEAAMLVVSLDPSALPSLQLPTRRADSMLRNLDAAVLRLTSEIGMAGSVRGLLHAGERLIDLRSTEQGLSEGALAMVSDVVAGPWTTYDSTQLERIKNQVSLLRSLDAAQADIALGRAWVAGVNKFVPGDVQNDIVRALISASPTVAQAFAEALGPIPDDADGPMTVQWVGLSFLARWKSARSQRPSQEDTARLDSVANEPGVVLATQWWLHNLPALSDVLARPRALTLVSRNAWTAGVYSAALSRPEDRGLLWATVAARDDFLPLSLRNIARRGVPTTEADSWFDAFSNGENFHARAKAARVLSTLPFSNPTWRRRSIEAIDELHLRGVAADIEGIAELALAMALSSSRADKDHLAGIFMEFDRIHSDRLKARTRAALRKATLLR